MGSSAGRARPPRTRRSARASRAPTGEQRELRPELDVGIGGHPRSRENLKCLHAHAAFALARPGYELGERMLAEVGRALVPGRALRAGGRDGPA